MAVLLGYCVPPCTESRLLSAPQADQGWVPGLGPRPGLAAGLGLAHISSKLWAPFLLALGQKGLVSGLGSIPSLQPSEGRGLLQEAQARQLSSAGDLQGYWVGFAR